MRRTFLGHWIICLVCAAAFAFAYAYGIPQLIWASDQSYMTSAIAALVVGAAIWLGRQAWLIDEPHKEGDWPRGDFGHEAQLLAPALGMLGTVIGLSMQAKALVAGAAGLGALSTSLFTTGAGIAGFIIIKILTYNFECGRERAWK